MYIEDKNHFHTHILMDSFFRHGCCVRTADELMIVGRVDDNSRSIRQFYLYEQMAD